MPLTVEEGTLRCIRDPADYEVFEHDGTRYAVVL